MRIVRSQSKLKNYIDHETDFPPSIVDDTDYEPLGEKVKKFLRGEKLPPAGPGGYEVPPGADLEGAIDALPPHRSDGFDLADAHVVRQAGLSAIREMRERRSAPRRNPPGPEGAGAEPPAPSPAALPAVTKATPPVDGDAPGAPPEGNRIVPR